MNRAYAAQIFTVLNDSILYRTRLCIISHYKILLIEDFQRVIDYANEINYSIEITYKEFNTDDIRMSSLHAIFMLRT